MPKTNHKVRVISARPAAPRRQKLKPVEHPAITPAPIAAAAPAADAPEKQARHTDIRQRAMLVKLEIHRWPASATDDQISDEVALAHGIAHDMGKYQKQLLPKSALEKLRSAGSRLKGRHNRLTLPWDEWSTRILSAQAFVEYNSAVRAGIDEFDQIFYDELEAIGATGVTKYEEAKAEAKRLLSGAFRESDYPSLSQLKRKFRAKVTVMPIPDAADFRIDLGAAETAQVRGEIEARVNDQIAEAIKGLYARVESTIAKLAEALKSEKTEEIRHTLFMAIHNVLDVLPLLNVTGDRALDAIGAEIRDMVAGCDVKSLKASEPMRQAVLEQAEAILSKMTDFLG